MANLLVVLSFSINLLEKLKVDRKNNSILNEDEFIDLIDRESYNDFEKAHDEFCEKVGVEGDFHHTFWTLMLNANYENFTGMRYGCLCTTVYQNNSSPNLVEVGITLPKYTSIPFEPLPKQYALRRYKSQFRKQHDTNPIIGVLREGFMNGVIGDSENVWQNNWWKGNPFNKNIADFNVINAKDNRQKSNIKYVFDEIKTKGKVFKRHLITINYIKDAHIITINDKIAFITTNRGAIDKAFEILTDVKDVGYNSESGSRRYATNEKTFEYKKKYFNNTETINQVSIL